MRDASALPIDHFPDLLARLPASLDLEALARETKAFCRGRGVQSGTDLLRLALAWGPGGYSLQRVAAWAGDCGIAQVTNEALVQRLHGAVAFLQAVVSRLLEQVGQAAGWHGRVLRIADSTSLSQPASQGTDWRLHGVYDLGRGGFSHLELTDAHGGEALDRGKPVAGEIRVADRNFANAPSWQRLLEAAKGGADYIVRMRWNTVRLLDAKGKRFDIIAWLRALPQDSDAHETVVWAQAERRGKPLRTRLIARRKTPEAIEATLKHLRRQASRKQHEINPCSLVAAEYLIVATSLAQAEFPLDEVLAAYRLRWQIELAFKRLKSLMQIDAIRTRTAAGTRCWLYAHMIVALLCQDISLDVLESFP